MNNHHKQSFVPQHGSCISDQEHHFHTSLSLSKSQIKPPTWALHPSNPRELSDRHLTTHTTEEGAGTIFEYRGPLRNSPWPEDGTGMKPIHLTLACFWCRVRTKVRSRERRRCQRNRFVPVAFIPIIESEELRVTLERDTVREKVRKLDKWTKDRDSSVRGLFYLQRAETSVGLPVTSGNWVAIACELEDSGQSEQV